MYRWGVAGSTGIEICMYIFISLYRSMYLTGRSGLPPARVLPPSRHPSDKAKPQEEKRRRG